MARDRTPTFGALVDARLSDPYERDRPSVLRELGPPTRCDRLFELVADLHDVLGLHDLPDGAYRKVGDDAVREAALAVAVEAARLWLASTGWPLEEAPGGG